MAKEQTNEQNIFEDLFFKLTAVTSYGNYHYIICAVIGGKYNFILYGAVLILIELVDYKNNVPYLMQDKRQEHLCNFFTDNVL